MMAKRAKLDVRSFRPSWTEDFAFVQKKDRAVCVICGESVVCRTSSVRRHFQAKHGRFFFDDANKIDTIKKAVASYEDPDGDFKHSTDKQKSRAKEKPNVGKSNATEGSYKIAQCIASRGRPFTDGEYVKDVFLSCAEALFDDFSNKDAILARIRELPVSARTIERRIGEMSENVQEKQTVALNEAAAFGVALDENVDADGVAQLLIAARYCAGDGIHEDLCCLKPLRGPADGEDVAVAFMDHFNERGIAVEKVFCVTTNGAPAMVDKDNGFLKILENRIGHSVLKFHGIFSQESLCDRISNSELNGVMDTVVRVVHFLVSQSSPSRRRFRTLLEEIDSAYVDVPIRSALQWFGRGNVLAEFLNSFDAIKIFLSEKGQYYPEMDDSKWLCKLAFLTDIVAHLNELSIRIQNGGQTILDLYEIWKQFVDRLTIFSRDIRTSNFRHFRHLRELSTRCGIDVGEIEMYLHALELEFSDRFQDFRRFGPMFSFLVQPDVLKANEIDLAAFRWMAIEDFELQLLELKSSELWVSKFATLRNTLGTVDKELGTPIWTCWTSLPANFATLKKLAFAMLSAFGSMSLCEQVAIQMKSMSSPVRNRLSIDRSEAWLQLKVSNYKPDTEKLGKEKQGQGSH